MKKKVFLFGMLAALVFGAMLAGCDTGGSGSTSGGNGDEWVSYFSR
jgi:hypothetical protein